MVSVKYVGHACFLVTAGGVRILTDPYEAGAFSGAIRHAPITDTADVVTVSHEHADHGHVAGLVGRPHILRQSGEYGGVVFRALHSYHDEVQGKKREDNRVFMWEAEGLRCLHLGDLGHPLPPEQVAALAPVSVLFTPVGGHFTIDAAQARQVAEDLQARIIIPMHFATDRTTLPLAPVEEFLGGYERVVRVGGPVLELDAAALPEEATVYVLDPAN